MGIFKKLRKKEDAPEASEPSKEVEKSYISSKYEKSNPVKEEVVEEINKEFREIADAVTLETAKTAKDNDLYLQFEKETGKHAIWGGKETKGYLSWKKEKGF